MRSRVPTRPDGGSVQPTHEVLLGLGGLLAVVLGPVFFLVSLPFEGFGAGGLVDAIISVVFGLLLLVSVGMLRRDLLTGLLVAFVSSLILFAGGLGGAIGGLFGLVGSVLVFAANYRELVG